ncbi:MAG: hypothetical protein ACOCWI_02905 [Bacillota bacterium]
METYIIGVLLAIMAGITNFTGPILQKKAINDIKQEKENITMRDLIRKPIWISGLLLICVVNVILIALAQSLIGAALIPGLTASGFIVLAIGSVKILGEKLKKQEIMAIALLLMGVIFVTMSQLSIIGDIERFYNTAFVVRISAFSILFLALWMGFFYGGKKSKKTKAVFMSFAVGFPFILSNVWVQPFMLSAQSVLSNDYMPMSIFVLIAGAAIVSLANIFGIIHMQHAMAEANASIVIPIHQVPQQISPIIIYFLIYMLAAPSVLSYFFIIIGMSMIIYAGFILSRRQKQIDKLVEETEKEIIK